MRYPERYRGFHTTGARDNAPSPPAFEALNGAERNVSTFIPTHADGTFRIPAPPVEIPTEVASYNHDGELPSTAHSEESFEGFPDEGPDHSSNTYTRDSTFPPPSASSVDASTLLNMAIWAVAATNPVMGTLARAIASSIPLEGSIGQASNYGSSVCDKASEDTGSYVSGATGRWEHTNSSTSSIAGDSKYR